MLGGWRVLLMRSAAARELIVLESSSPIGPDFDEALRSHGLAPLVRDRLTTLQLNVGKFCNMACHHCHVEAGPNRTEKMRARVADRVLELLAARPGVEVLDLTGGAPELNEHFRRLVREARRLGKRVIDRCNLTVLFEPEMDDLAEFLAAHEVHVVASLPCYQAANVEKQRGKGAFDKSIEALRLLNAKGYGQPETGLRLDLVYNPLGATLPPPQSRLETKYREELGRLFGVEFNSLLTITNMPIKRFAAQLERQGQTEAYMGLLANHFNPDTVPALMCQSLISVGWDGRLYDCDFNQMLDVELSAAQTGVRTIWDIDSLDRMVGQPIATRSHCFGCTAGAGSSCSGAIR
jgi:radical SAM/Cys-rich protein